MPLIGLRDSDFIRGKVPMTKSEIRAITISKLQLIGTHRILDIGAGTGSLSIEAALQEQQSTVYAIEKKEEACNLVEQNIKNFNVDNIKLIRGIAPHDLPNINVDRAIIGGSGGQINLIFDWLESHLERGGIIVANCITLENTVSIINNLRARNYINIEVIQASISKGKNIANLTMMLAHNPVYIICGTKEECVINE